jgi:hypothetical protein
MVISTSSGGTSCVGINTRPYLSGSRMSKCADFALLDLELHLVSDIVRVGAENIDQGHFDVFFIRSMGFVQRDVFAGFLG